MGLVSSTVGKIVKAGLAQMSRRRLPQVDGRLYLPGLHHTVTIRRDRWGIPHIHAANRHDLFFAQGIVHAQDRLWQMEINRRAANGQLAAILGPLALDTDRLARTLGFARSAAQTWPQLGEQVQKDVLAYTAGINALLQSRPPLPVELALIRHRPAPWHPVDSLAYGRLQMWALACGATGELVQAQLLEKLGPQKAQQLGLHYPAGNPATLPQGIEFNRWAADGLLQTAVGPFLGKGQLDGAGRGSNGWVISAQRSATGHPILCNDMHLPVTTPSLWYYLHLRSDDGFHVAGFSQPGLPYILAGHNEHIAWGATVSYIDCEDLFVEQFHPENPTLYRFREAWRLAEMIEEPIAVRGRRDHVERVVLTHHGPIVSQVLASNGQALALSSTALHAEQGFAGFAALNEARDWDDFVTAATHIDAPSLNLLYADTQGNIGHWVTGRVPIRAKGDGRVPVPGWTGEYEWTGYIPCEKMPHALNPKQGYIVSANNRIIDDSYPYFLGHAWRSGYRARRLQQLIESRESVSLADCRRFHLDFQSIPGRALVAQLAAITPKNPDAAVSLRLLHHWDGCMGPESCGGTVYQVLLMHLARAILSPHLDEESLLQFLGKGSHPILAPVNEFQGYWPTTLLRLLADPETALLPQGAARDDLMERCLAETTAELHHRLGPDPQQWQWGRLHQVRFPHVLGRRPPLDLIFSQGPYATGGDSDTVAQAGIRPDMPYENNAVSVSSRHIVDLGNLANSWAMYAPGQSGHMGSEHYGDLIQPWLQGDYFPMGWGEEEDTAACRHTLIVSPNLREV